MRSHILFTTALILVSSSLLILSSSQIAEDVMTISDSNSILQLAQTQLLEDSLQSELSLIDSTATPNLVDDSLQNGMEANTTARNNSKQRYSRKNSTRSTYRQYSYKENSSSQSEGAERLNGVDDQQNLKSSYRGSSFGRYSSSKSYFGYSGYRSSYNNYYGGGPSVIIIGGYYNQHYGYSDSSDVLCNNKTCQFCCVKGECKSDTFCQRIAPKGLDAVDVIILIMILLSCCGCCFAIFRYIKRRYHHGVHEPFNHSFHSHSSHHSHSHHHQAHQVHQQQQFYVPPTHDGTQPPQQQQYNPINGYPQEGQTQLQGGYPVVDQNLQQQQMQYPPMSYPPMTQAYPNSDFQQTNQLPIQNQFDQNSNLQAQETHQQQYYVPPTQQQQTPQ
ncbi:UNKNOWN [Stylonychia lemnae]|uniref:Uncharacterized protein n=1 Tax=Stylonychia lemnae TaxID=5949 RepID=A0A078B1H9_STYLE|nr:UNKNOWN [Stylonychia lemnae]|eukprot:CDW87192.1 UNKNOWN [Stylonychia lemnae]